ncbi:hypothetical protein O6H91_13G064400 [Diphasiastrum complanatum]|uniref:Uncharacterized protein n=1 Tax=Diphasiastrum complanatum TaxID=34168 RepID=A0ACC2BVK7_DIPCM|nr:hypothetical protein O6H91_13G064400 [Diphasiastrum complanatum]
MTSDNKEVVREFICKICPSQTRPNYTYFLSNLDLLFALNPEYIRKVFYFRTKGADGVSKLSIQSLKDSLSRVLSLYPILAGRLKKGESGRLKVDVNGEGIPFIEAKTNARLEDWQDLRLCDIQQELNPKDSFIRDICKAPPIRVQVTTFSCGSIALGLSSLHILADGLSTIEFVKAWGEIHRGAEVSNKPQFESMRLRARDPPQVSILSADEIFASCKPLVSLPSSAPVNSSIGYRTTTFRISRRMIDKCIKDVETGAFSCGPPSSFEALSALFWRAVTRARGVEDSSFTTYVFPVSLRGRLQPPLPKGYFGNAVILAQVTAAAKDIKSNDFSFAASLIHKRVQMVDSEFIQSAIDWMELRLQQQHAIGVGFELTGKNLINTSFANFPVYEIDFGWRKLDHFEFTMHEDSPVDGLLYILPSPPDAGGDNSREVKLRLREDHLERMLHDPQFQPYFPQELSFYS